MYEENKENTLTVFIGGGNPHISGPAQFKPILFKGLPKTYMYMCIYAHKYVYIDILVLAHAYSPPVFHGEVWAACLKPTSTLKSCAPKRPKQCSLGLRITYSNQ